MMRLGRFVWKHTKQTVGISVTAWQHNPLNISHCETTKKTAQYSYENEKKNAYTLIHMPNEYKQKDIFISCFYQQKWMGKMAWRATIFKWKKLNENIPSKMLTTENRRKKKLICEWNPIFGMNSISVCVQPFLANFGKRK